MNVAAWTKKRNNEQKLHKAPPQRRSQWTNDDSTCDSLCVGNVRARLSWEHWNERGLERFSGGEILNSGDFAEMVHTVVTAAACYLVDGPSSGRAVPSVHLISDRPWLSIARVWQADPKVFLLLALRRRLMWHFHRQTTVYSKHRPRRSRDGSFFSLLRHLMLGSVIEELARLVNLWKQLQVCCGLIKEVWSRIKS